MRSGGTTAIGRSSHIMSWGRITWMLYLSRWLEIVTAATAISKMASRPWGGVVVRQVDTAIVPWIAVCVEASRGFDGDQRSLGHIARTIFEERTRRRLRTVLATI